MKLFKQADVDKINAVAAKSKEVIAPPKVTKVKTMTNDLQEMSQRVIEYFKDSESGLIERKDQLHDYIDKCIEAGIAGIDTETTGLDRQKDWIVGSSLYYPGGHEAYIPNKHIVPIFENLYPNQLTYEDCKKEFQRLADNNVKLVFANADFDLWFIYKDYQVDLIDAFYYDVIYAWRVIKSNEPDNALKVLYNKYCLKGKGDPMKFNDFFSVQLFPYCKPAVAKLYAANDAKITYDLMMWQLPYITKDHPKCKKKKMERLADVVWNIEMPMTKVCQNLYRRGLFVDKETMKKLQNKYHAIYHEETTKLAAMVQDLIDNGTYTASTRRPFQTGKDFNESSPVHVKYLIYTMLGTPVGKNGMSTDKQVLTDIGHPITKQILAVRGAFKLLNTYVDKLPKELAKDGRIHAQFISSGAECVTGDTIVPTASGYFTIRELCKAAEDDPGNHVDVDNMYIVNKDQKSEKVQSTIYYSNVPTVKITTDYGFVLEGTYNHPVMVSKYTKLSKPANKSDIWKDRYFKNLSDIQIGDIVELPCNYSTTKDYVKTNLHLGPIYNNRNAQAIMPEVFDEDFGEFLGMYHADGSASFRDGTYTIALSNADAEVIERFTHLAKKLFNVDVSHYTAQKDKNEVETYINCKRLSELDSILSHGKQRKKIPECIWRSPASVINAYIRGLTLDSSVSFEKGCPRCRFELSVINELDARMIQMHLMSQGILCYWGFNDNKDFRSPRLQFSPDHYMRFVDRIGFIESRKIVTTAPNSRNTYQDLRINDSFRVSVKKIEYCTNDVYDLHIPGTHSFISNGMISHNTGRMSSRSPNLQNIPSHAEDIRHMFRATPGYVLMSSDYSSQEPRITAYVSQSKELIEAFQNNKDVYATIASVAFKLPYENCLEFHPETGEYQADGKARRTEAKSIVLGICYGRSVPSIGEQLYGKRKDMTDEQKTKEAQKVYDAVMNSFPDLRKAMFNAQQEAHDTGYVETVFGSRRYLPDMMLDEFEFQALPGYVNPDVDPLNPSTLTQQSDIPVRIVNALKREFSNYKYFGQIAKRTKQLYENDHIKVINNRAKINDASRQCLNTKIQGSAAMQTKLAMIMIQNDEEFNRLGGRMLVPIHDEIMIEAPVENAQRCGELLSGLMCKAASFLPFPSKCDVTTSMHWYGLEYPCPYEKPKSWEYMTEDNIKWVQYYLLETEYVMPVFKDADGNKPIGNAGKGVSGIESDEYRAAIQDYIDSHKITKDEFFDHIENNVNGIVNKNIK